MSETIVNGFVSWERFEALCNQMNALEAECARMRALLRRALPEMENLMPLARDPLNTAYRWLPAWLAEARKMVNQDATS